MDFQARKPTKSIGPFTTPDTRTGPQASSTIIYHRRSYVEQLPELLTIIEAPVTEGLKVRIAREDGTTLVSRLHPPLQDN